ELVDALVPDHGERRAFRYVIPHQVSRALIDEVIAETGLGGEVLWNAREFGNLGGASVLFTLADALARNVFAAGDRILFLSVGGGLSMAGQIWESKKRVEAP